MSVLKEEKMTYWLVENVPMQKKVQARQSLLHDKKGLVVFRQCSKGDNAPFSGSDSNCACNLVTSTQCL